MNFLKKLSVSNYLVCAGALLGLVAVIMAGVSNAAIGYPIDNIGWIVALSVIGILSAIGTVVLAVVLDKPFIAEALTYVTVGTLVAAMGIFIAARGELVGYITVIAGPAEYSAFDSFIVGMVFYLLAAIVMTVSAFFKTKK